MRDAETQISGLRHRASDSPAPDSGVGTAPCLLTLTCWSVRVAPARGGAGFAFAWPDKGRDADDRGQRSRPLSRLWRGPAVASTPPPFFVDLNLDQIVASVTAGKEEYDLAPFFFRPLQTVDEVTYRQAVMRDLENSATYDAVSKFAERMRQVRGRLAQIEKLYYRYQKEAWLLDAVADYWEAVETLRSRLLDSGPKSVALLRFVSFLDSYVDASRFREMKNDAVALRAKLAAIRYFLVIGGRRHHSDRIPRRNRLRRGDRGGLRQIQTRGSGRIRVQVLRNRPA